MAKKICGLIFDRIFPAILVIGGTFALIYGMWFQTEGFTLYDQYGVCPWDTCVLIAAGCVILGLFIMSYFRGQTRKTEKGGKKVGIRDLKNMMRGYVFCGYLCWGVLWIAYSVNYFYVGIAGLSLCICTTCYYLIWLYVSERMEKKAEAEKEASGKA